MLKASDHIDTIIENCEVSAIGACFLSHVRLYNDTTVGEILKIDDQEMVDKMKNAFTDKTLQEIEDAFEDGTGLKDVYKHDNERLKVIMKNVIKNKGVFVSEKSVEEEGWDD